VVLVEGWPISFGLLSDVGALAVFTWLEDQNLSSETAGTGKVENSSVSIGIGRDSPI